MSSTAWSNGRLSLYQQRCNLTAILFLSKFSGVYRYPQQQKWNWRKLLVLKAFGSQTTTLLTHYSYGLCKARLLQHGDLRGNGAQGPTAFCCLMGMRARAQITARTDSKVLSKNWQRVQKGSVRIWNTLPDLASLTHRAENRCMLQAGFLVNVFLLSVVLEENISTGREMKLWKIMKLNLSFK